MSRAPETAPHDELFHALDRAAPHVSEAGAWDAVLPRARRIRRRRAALRGGVSVLLVGMLAVVALQLADVRPGGSDFTGTTVPDDAPTAATLPPAPATPTATVLPEGSTDPRAVAVRDWMRALAAGDLDAAWDLLDPRAQEEYGSPEEFAAAAASLKLRWGSWAWADLQLVDLGVVDGERLAVVTAYGQWKVAGDAAIPRADTLLVVTRLGDGSGGDIIDGGAGTVSGVDPLRLLVADDPSESSLVDERRVPAFTLPDKSGTTLVFDSPVAFTIPVEAGAGGFPVPAAGRALFAVDSSVLPGSSQDVALDGGFTRFQPLSDLGSGSHVATVVFLPESDHLPMSAAAITFSTEDGAPPTTTSPPPYIAPFSPDALRAAEDAARGLLAAVRDGDVAAFASHYAEGSRRSAEQLYIDESARLAALGPEAYTVSDRDPPVVNWMVGGDWARTWIPLSPTQGLGQWVAADPLARMLVSVTTADGFTRFLPLEVDGDTVTVQVLGGDPDMDALGAFDLHGRTPPTALALYFAAFQKNDYAGAWAFLSSTRPSLERFKRESAATAGPERRETDTWVILDNGDAWVDVRVLSPPGYSREGAKVTETWLLVRENGEWRVDHAESGPRNLVFN